MPNQNKIEAKPGCCEEASLFGPPNMYVPCNQPATKMVGWKNEGPYRMCDMCADHSVKNRNAATCEDINPNKPPAPKAIFDQYVDEFVAQYIEDRKYESVAVARHKVVSMIKQLDEGALGKSHWHLMTEVTRKVKAQGQVI